MKKEDFIVLIGSDGAGKSTIAEGLHNVLGYPVEHHGPVKSYNEGFFEYFECIKNTDYSVIKDRFHEGEKIFAPLYRNYEAEYFPELEKKLMEKFNPLLVLVNAPYSIIKTRLLNRGEDFVEPRHFRHCYNKVIEVFNDSSLPKIIIDTNEYSVEYNVETIVKRLNM